jgi:hypothetical protein
LRVIPVRGNPLPIDSTAWADFKQQGISDRLRRDNRLSGRYLPLPTVRRLSRRAVDGANIYSAEVLADFNYLREGFWSHIRPMEMRAARR